MLPFSSSPKHNRCHPWISEFIVANLESKTFGWNLMCSKSCASEIYSFLKIQLVLGSKKVCLQNHREKRWFRDDMIIWGPALLFSNFDQPSPSCWKTWEETAMEDRALRSWRRRAATRRTTLTRFSLSRHLSAGLMVSGTFFIFDEGIVYFNSFRRWSANFTGWWHWILYYGQLIFCCLRECSHWPLK